MNAAQPDLIAIGAKRYTIVSVCSCLVVCAIIVAIVVIFCPLYLLISFFVGAAVGPSPSGRTAKFWPPETMTSASAM